MTGDDAARRARAVRRWMWIFGVLFAAISAGLVTLVVVVLRDPPARACVALLGPLDRLAPAAGGPLELADRIGGDLDCRLTVWRAGAPIARLAITPSVRYDAERARLSRESRLRGESLPGGAGTLFVALASGVDHVALIVRGDALGELTLDARALAADRARALAAAVAAPAGR